MNLNPITVIFHMKFSFVELLARLKRKQKLSRTVMCHLRMP